MTRVPWFRGGRVVAAIESFEDTSVGAAIIGVAHGKRATEWALLTGEYKILALKLHFLALGYKAEGPNDVGPIYVTQALAMQRQNMIVAVSDTKDLPLSDKLLHAAATLRAAAHKLEGME